MISYTVGNYVNQGRLCGTGVNIDRSEKVFVIQQALALAYLRMTFPADTPVTCNNVEIPASGTTPLVAG